MKTNKLNLNREFYRTRCDEVNIFDAKDRKRIEKVIESLRDYLRKHKDLVAISAPQLAHRDRIFCIKFEGNDIRTFINPLVMERKDMHLNEEKQLGFGEFDNDTYFVPRYSEITAGYQTPTGRVESNVFKGQASAIFEQMNQLLDGVFISDFGLIKLDGFDDLPEEEKKEIFSMYAKSILDNKHMIDKSLEENPESKELDKMTKYYTDLLLGKVEVLDMTEEEKQKIIESRKEQK